MKTISVIIFMITVAFIFKKLTPPSPPPLVILTPDPDPDPVPVQEPPSEQFDDSEYIIFE